MRSDGLVAVLGPLLQYRPIRGVMLVDLQSGMVLDACGTGTDERELLGARHAELMRTGLDALRTPRGAVGAHELVLTDGHRCHHALRAVSDPHGDGLVLSAVVHGSGRQLQHVLHRLRRVPAAALTAGPSLRRRPVAGAWSLAGPMWTAAPEPAMAYPERPSSGTPARADPAPERSAHAIPAWEGSAPGSPRWPRTARLDRSLPRPSEPAGDLAPGHPPSPPSAMPTRH